LGLWLVVEEENSGQLFSLIKVSQFHQRVHHLVMHGQSLFQPQPGFVVSGEVVLFESFERTLQFRLHLIVHGSILVDMVDLEVGSE